MRVIDRQLLARVVQQAKEAPRRRKNYNLHPADVAKCHRLLNAIEPGSYIRPHRHLDLEKDEAFVILQGKLAVISFDEQGTILATAILAVGGEAVAADIPHGVFHTAVSLASGTVFFEAKAGPYLPFAEAEKAPWAPDEGVPEAAAYLAILEQRVAGQKD
jgi:cupin fold WbuC family metalloprotein